MCKINTIHLMAKLAPTVSGSVFQLVRAKDRQRLMRSNRKLPNYPPNHRFITHIKRSERPELMRS